MAAPLPNTGSNPAKNWQQACQMAAGLPHGSSPAKNWQQSCQILAAALPNTGSRPAKRDQMFWFIDFVASL